MARVTDENLLLLVEIMAKEIGAIRERCRDVRFWGQAELAMLSETTGVDFGDWMEFVPIRDYDAVLEEISERSKNLIRMSAERVKELIGPVPP